MVPQGTTAAFALLCRVLCALFVCSVLAYHVIFSPWSRSVPTVQSLSVLLRMDPKLSTMHLSMRPDLHTPVSLLAQSLQITRMYVACSNIKVELYDPIDVY